MSSLLHRAVLSSQAMRAAERGERVQVRGAGATVHVPAHRARVRIARAQARHEELELHRLLHEAPSGPVPSDPPEGLYPVTGPGQGEPVRLRGELVTAVDLVAR